MTDHADFFSNKEGLRARIRHQSSKKWHNGVYVREGVSDSYLFAWRGQQPGSIGIVAADPTLATYELKSEQIEITYLGSRGGVTTINSSDEDFATCDQLLTAAGYKPKR